MKIEETNNRTYIMELERHFVSVCIVQRLKPLIFSCKLGDITHNGSEHSLFVRLSNLNTSIPSKIPLLCLSEPYSQTLLFLIFIVTRLF